MPIAQHCQKHNRPQPELKTKRSFGSSPMELFPTPRNNSRELDPKECCTDCIRYGSSSHVLAPLLPSTEWLGKYLLGVSKGKTFQAAVNSPSQHTSPEKRDCLPAAGGSGDVGRL